MSYDKLYLLTETISCYGGKISHDILSCSIPTKANFFKFVFFPKNKRSKSLNQRESILNNTLISIN